MTTRNRHQEGRDAADKQVAREGLVRAKASLECCCSVPMDAYDLGFQQRITELEAEQAKLAKSHNRQMMVTVGMEHVDWELLRVQKQALLEVIDEVAKTGQPRRSSGTLSACFYVEGTKPELLQGILHLIDHIQDEAAHQLDEETVFGNLEGTK